jgi:RHS repeat-associated protein
MIIKSDSPATMKTILYLIVLLVLIGAQAVSQTLTLTGPNPACPPANGTLTVSNYTSVIQWEAGEMIGSTFYVFETYDVTTPTFSYYNLTYPTSFRAKLRGGVRPVYSTILDVNVFPGSAGGTLAGAASFVTTGSGTLTLSGHTGTIVKWQKSTNGGSPWTDIAFTGTAYPYSDVATTTHYRVMVQSSTCAVAYSNVATITIYSIGNIAGPATGGDECPVTLTFQNYSGTIGWEYSTDGGSTWIPAGDSPTYKPVITADLKVRVRTAINSHGTYYTPVKDITWVPYSEANPVPDVAGVNFVRVQSVTAAGTTDTAQVDGLTTASKREAFIYQDGHGATLQQVMRKAGPAEKDIVNFSVRSATNVAAQYLPYVSTQDNGTYKSAALTEQAAYYVNGTNDKVADSPSPFVQAVYEKSPLGRLKEQGMAGLEWQPGSGHTVTVAYGTNESNEVRLFLPDGSSTGFYAANELSKQEVTDQDGSKRQVFTDRSGRTILQKVQLDEPIDGTNVPWLETYYIYTTSDRLRYIISPKGVKALQDGSWSFTAALKDQYVYEFVYDNLARVVEKKVPGQAWLYYAYDRLDRIVLVQDGNIRAQNKWYFIKYDRSGRPVMQGLYTNTTHTTRSAIQTNIVDPLYAIITDKYYEERGTALHGYTNQSFPTTGTEVLTINYYDSYDFDFNGTADYAYTAQSLAGEGTPGTPLSLPTGSKRLVLGTSTWLSNCVFYDVDGRVLQVRGNNHLSSAVDNVSTNVYDFEGKLKLSKIYHNAGTAGNTTVINKYEYDLQGRLIKIYQNNNAAPSDQLVVQYEYNALGQVVDKKLHHNGSAFLQSIDYRYSINGWLESINNAQLGADARNDDTDAGQSDYFGLELLYNTTANGLDNTARYNGSVSAMLWKAPAAPMGNTIDQRSYKFTYDKSDQLKTSTSQIYTGSDWTKEAGALNESMTYDHNGNIKTLQRNGRKHQLSGVTASYISEAIDNLTYSYSTTYANQLLKVEDAAANTAGFKNGVNVATEYTYDVTGNVTADQNKGISSVGYNFLGKPTQINFIDGRKIDYVYDASGTKLTMKAWQGATLTNTTDYIGSFVYENGVLSFFGSPEGRVVKNGSGLEYQYALADHQGNTRVVFTAAVPAPIAPQATFEGDANDGASQYTINASNVVSFGSANHTSGGSKVVRMNQTYKIGPSQSIAVVPGDKVDMEVWEYHEGSSGFGTSSTPLGTLITAVAGSFGGISGGAGESGMIYSGVNNALGAFSAGGNQGDSRPAAYLNYILFDKDYKVLNAGWQLAPATTFTKQKLSFPTLNIKEAGYVFVYLSYDDDSNNWVYFDDLKVTHTKTNIIQYNEYYPFGLQTGNSWTRKNHKNDFLYNASSEFNQASGWYETFYRGYDPALGRFMQVDPMAAQYASITPYNYCGSNPVMFNDPLGDQPVPRWYPTAILDDGTVRPDMSGSQSQDIINQWNGYWSNDNYMRNMIEERLSPQAAAEQLGGIPVTNPEEIAAILNHSFGLSENGQWGSYEEVLTVYSDGAGGVVAELGVEFTPVAQQSGLRNPGDPTKVLAQAHILIARMFFNAPDAVSFAGGVDLGAIVGGAFQKGKIYGLTGSIKGQSTSFVDSGLGFEVGGTASLNISEYYFFNLTGKNYTLTMDDFSGQRFSINAGASVVMSLGFGVSIAPIGGGWDSGMYIISKTYAYGAGIEGLPINANYGQTKTYK